MVRSYKKKGFRSRRKAKRSYVKNRMSARKAAFKALRTVRQVADKVERKTRATLSTSVNLTQANGGTNVNSTVVGVPNGDGRDERSGNKISPTYAKFHGQIVWNASGGTDQWVRMIIVRDRRTNPTTSARILTGNSDIDLMSGPDFLAEYNVRTRSRYEVLYSKHFKYDTRRAIDEPIYFTGRFKPPKTVLFDGSSDGSGDITKNNVYCLAWGSASAQAYPIAFGLFVRLWYQDI